MVDLLTELVMGTTPIVTEETRPFWDATVNEELHVQVCDECGARQLPGGPCCSRCWSMTFHWERASGRGQVFSYTIVRHAFHPAFADDVPYVVADVELDEGPILTTNVTDCPVQAVRIDMEVEVHFAQEVNDPFGSLLRLPLFRPIA
jgi:hypothetical protein